MHRGPERTVPPRQGHGARAGFSLLHVPQPLHARRHASACSSARWAGPARTNVPDPARGGVKGESVSGRSGRRRVPAGRDDDASRTPSRAPSRSAARRTAPRRSTVGTYAIAGDRVGARGRRRLEDPSRSTCDRTPVASEQGRDRREAHGRRPGRRLHLEQQARARAPDASGPADPPPRQPDGRRRPAAGQRPRRRWPRQPRGPSCGSRKTRLRRVASASVISARYRVVVRNRGPATARAVSLQEQGRSPARGNLSLRTTKGTLSRHAAAPLPRSATCAQASAPPSR